MAGVYCPQRGQGADRPAHREKRLTLKVNLEPYLGVRLGERERRGQLLDLRVEVKGPQVQEQGEAPGKRILETGLHTRPKA